MLTPYYVYIFTHASCKNPFIEGYHTAILLCLFKWHCEACKEVWERTENISYENNSISFKLCEERRFLNFTHCMEVWFTYGDVLVKFI